MGNMFFVYILQSQNHKYIYVGMTNDIERRVHEHNIGKEKTTGFYAPFRLIHSESFKTRPEARQRERYLKSGCGKEWIKQNFNARVAKR